MRNPDKFFLGLGFMFLFAALALGLYNVWDERRAGMAALDVIEQMQIPDEPSDVVYDFSKYDYVYEYVPLYKLNPQIDMPTVEIDGTEYIGVLEIPALSLTLPVISRWSYPGLKISPCRYTGSAYLDNLVIAAHNYASHFGGIKTLGYGDTVIFTDEDGNVFTYEVREVEVLQPTAVAEMMESDWALTLFTCTIGGATRVTVRCENVTE